MEDIKINLRKDSNDMNEAPPLETNRIYYNCSECSSIIEILSIDEEFIEFKCNNNHKLKMKAKDYLDKMKKYNSIELHNNKCNVHKEEYIVYCFECNAHLCRECLKLGEHGSHYKINIIEIIPNNEILSKVKNLIQDNKKEIKILNKTQLEATKKTTDLLNDNINKINDTKIKIKERNNGKELHELELNINNYKLEIEELKKEYENKIKKLKSKYNNNINNIKNKYKIINDINEKIYHSKIKSIINKVDLKINNYKFKETMDKISCFNELIEIIYNTYKSYNNNYYNTLNINNIINKFFNIDNPINKFKEKYSIIKDFEDKLKEQINEKENLIITRFL